MQSAEFIVNHRQFFTGVAGKQDDVDMCLASLYTVTLKCLGPIITRQMGLPIPNQKRPKKGDYWLSGK
jgi:hypothetical protein